MTVFNLTSSPDNVPTGLEYRLKELMKGSSFRGIETLGGLRAVSPTLLQHSPNIDIRNHFNNVDVFNADAINITYDENPESVVANVSFLKLDDDDASELAQMVFDIPKARNKTLYVDRSDLTEPGTLYTAYALMPDCDRSREEISEFFTELETKDKFKTTVRELIDGHLDVNILPHLVPEELVGIKGHPWLYYDRNKANVYVTLHEPQAGKLIVSYSYDVDQYLDDDAAN